MSGYGLIGCRSGKGRLGGHELTGCRIIGGRLNGRDLVGCRIKRSCLERGRLSRRDISARGLGAGDCCDPIAQCVFNREHVRIGDGLLDCGSLGGQGLGGCVAGRLFIGGHEPVVIGRHGRDGWGGSGFNRGGMRAPTGDAALGARSKDVLAHALSMGAGGGGHLCRLLRFRGRHLALLACTLLVGFRLLVRTGLGCGRLACGGKGQLADGVVGDAQAGLELGDGSCHAGALLVEGALTCFLAGTLGRLAGLGFLTCAFLGLAGFSFGRLSGNALRFLAGDALGFGTLGRLAGLPLGALLGLELCLGLSRSLGGLGLQLAALLTGLGGLDGCLHAGPLVLAALGSLASAFCLLAGGLGCLGGLCGGLFLLGLLGLKKLGVEFGVAQHGDEDAAFFENLDARRSLEVLGFEHRAGRVEADVGRLYVVGRQHLFGAFNGDLLAVAELLAQQTIDIEAVARGHRVSHESVQSMRAPEPTPCGGPG